MTRTLFTTALLAATTLLAFGPARADVTLAVVGPVTGQYASFFEQMKRGAEAAAEKINASGGINGEPLVLRMEDDACDPKQAVAIANKLSGENIAGVIGHLCTSSSIPASEIYAESGIPMISAASTGPLLTERGLANVFRTCGRDDQQAVIAADSIIRQFPGRKIAIVHDKSTYGQGLADGVRKALNAGGVSEIAFETLTQGEKDFSTLVSKLKSVNADVVFFGGYFAEGGLLVRQAREQGLEAVFMGGDGIAATEFASIAGPAADGVLMTFYPDPRDNPKAAAIVDGLRKSGYEPEGYTLYTYAAVTSYADAARTVQSVDGTRVAGALHAGTFDTVLGPLSFDAKGDPNTEPFIVYIWKDGSYAPAGK